MKACGGSLLTGITTVPESDWGGHAGTSQVTVQALELPEYIPGILGQHHGFIPDVGSKRAGDSRFGGKAWQVEREKLLVWLKDALKLDWPTIRDFPQARLVAGLTTVADWIGSGEFFEDPKAPWRPAISQALDKAGFVTPQYRQGLSFSDVFGKGFSPRPAQQALINQINGSGVYVLEAPMGVGKTEAALYAAYRLLETQQATGVYFALPTQLTSNKMYQRFNQFLGAILDEHCALRALLLHGDAWLVETDMGEEGRPGGSWFNQAKRGLLAPFAVGTVDQALMAAMNVRHGFVRAFGLAGKVVILDEVHTYDAYTGSLLDALIRLLRELHCTVIVLSATLNQSRRSELLDSSVGSHAYPLVSAIPKCGSLTEVAVPVDAERTVAIKLLPDDALACEEALLRAEQGQQVLWIENTVREAQQRYLDLAARAHDLGVECGLLHSRFTQQDRQTIEEKWVSLFGKEGASSRGEKGRILVGTQVLEQSLDIDADFLVMRFAPTDMLLQRMGRLWRHASTKRPDSARAEAWILAPGLDAAIENPVGAFGSTAYVYDPYVLCRSLEVWKEKGQVVLPTDIRDLIEATYADRTETGNMTRWQRELDEGNKKLHHIGRKALRQFARVALAEVGQTQSDKQAQTRYSEGDAFDVLLLKQAKPGTSEESAILTLLDGTELELPLRKSALPPSAWRRITARLMTQVVSVRMQDCPRPILRDTLCRYGLQHCFYLGNAYSESNDSLLRVALVSEDDSLRSIESWGSDAHDRYKIEYREDLGYLIAKP